MRKNIFINQIKNSIFIPDEYKQTLMVEQIPDKTFFMLENFFNKYAQKEKKITDDFHWKINWLVVNYIRYLEDKDKINDVKSLEELQKLLNDKTLYNN